MTDQEFFDTVVGHLRKQGRQSISNEVPGGCAYRGANGSMCAVGIFIKDEFYRADLESRSIAHDDVVDAVEKSIGSRLLNSHKAVLGALQSVHDNHDNWDRHGFDGEEGVKYVAQCYGLTYTAPQVAA